MVDGGWGEWRPRLSQVDLAGRQDRQAGTDGMKPAARLAIIVDEMKPGQRYIPVASDSQSLQGIWPNPIWPDPEDGFRTPRERADHWGRVHCCRVHEILDPPGIEIEKQWPEPNHEPRHHANWIGE